jgi:hypothetical protein
MKTCSKCKESKELDNFAQDLRRSDGKNIQCKSCINSRNKVYRTKDPLRFKHYKRKTDLRIKYGITELDFETKLKSQNYVCAICGSSKTGAKHKKNLSIDHSHKSGKIRGLLCDPCNRGLGLLKEDKNLLKKAIGYLEEYETDKSSRVGHDKEF